MNSHIGETSNPYSKWWFSLPQPEKFVLPTFVLMFECLTHIKNQTEGPGDGNGSAIGSLVLPKNTPLNSTGVYVVVIIT